MARIAGGIFSAPRGTTSGIVFGAARTRDGKVTTSRAWNKPANPRTGAQQLQRGKFLDCLQVVRDFGPSIYQGDWDRAIGQLPGFQSMMSILLHALNDSFEFAAPPDTPLGPLHFPATWGITTAGGAGQLTATWSTELGPDGTASDQLQLIGCLAARDADGLHPVFFALDTAVRSAGTIAISTGQDSLLCLIGGWFQGAGTAAGRLSRTEWRLQTSQPT